MEAIPPEAVVALQEGRTIDAIKIVREREKLDLKTAKDRVDQYIAGNPILRAQQEQARQSFRAKLLPIILITDTLIVAGLLYWFFGRK